MPEINPPYEPISGALSVVAATGDTVLVNVRGPEYAIYITAYHARVTGASATTWSLEDSAGTPLSVSGALSTATAPVTHEMDFGDNGMPLGVGKNFVLNVGAAGAAGVIVWEGYQRPVLPLHL